MIPIRSPKRMQAEPVAGPGAYAQSDWRIYFYFIMQLIGATGLTLLLVTMLWPSKHRRRRKNPLLVSHCIAWWFSTFPCLCVLYYAGQVTGPPPTHGVCLTSAVLTMAQQVLASTTAPALVFHVWLVVRSGIKANFGGDAVIIGSTIVCLLLPYVLFVIYGSIALAMGLAKPYLVHRVLFYCVVSDDALTSAFSAIGVIEMALAVIFEIWTIVLLRKNRVLIKRLSLEDRGLDLPLVIRVCLFGIYMVLGLGLNAIAIFNWDSPIPDLFFATSALATFLIFGTQRDIWMVWGTIASRNSPKNSSHALQSWRSPNHSQNLSNRIQTPLQSHTGSHRRSQSWAIPVNLPAISRDPACVLENASSIKLDHPGTMYEIPEDDPNSKSGDLMVRVTETDAYRQKLDSPSRTEADKATKGPKKSRRYSTSGPEASAVNKGGNVSLT